MAKDQTASPGTHIPGPLWVEAMDPAQTDFTAVASALTDNTAGTADTTIADVSTAVTGVDGTGSNAASKADVDARLAAIDENFADLTAQINAILERIQ